VSETYEQPEIDGRRRRVTTRGVVIATLLASIVAIGLLHWVLTARFAALTEARAERAVMIAARAAGDLAAHDGASGEALRAGLSAWQKKHAGVRAVRAVNLDERTLEFSTFPADQAAGPAPRRLERPEKDLYDLGRALAASVESNASQGSRQEDEVRIERIAGAVLIAVPVERDGVVTGFVQIEGVPEIVAVDAPGVGFALAFALAPVLLIFGLPYATGRRITPSALVWIAAALLLLTLFAYRQWAMRSLESGARAAERRVAERVEREAEFVGSIAPAAAVNSASWDADARRVALRIDPVRAVEGEKATVAEAGYGIAVLALLVLLFFGTGAAPRFWQTLVRHRQAYAYVAPAMVGMLILVFFPFIYGFVLSFTNQTIYSVNEPFSEIWVGVQNYRDILGDFNPVRHTDAGRAANFENFYWTLFFTIAWTVVNVTIGVTCGLLLALILNTKGLRFKAAYRVLLILPWATPNYITALIWKGMFHQQFGVFNQVLQLFGAQPIAWFEKPLTSFIAIVATNGWLSFPFMMVVSLGALQSIPSCIYEAARVDGASRWQQFASITLPSLRPALIPAIILSVVWTFNMFNIPYLVSAGEPAHSTEILITQSYKIAFEQYRYGYAAAYSTVIFAILLVYGVFQNRITRATESIAS
jgi:arabinogalactan oligomer/maltooligosaccharide transport system permease protein